MSLVLPDDGNCKDLQVDIIEPEILQTGIDGARDVVSGALHFGSHKELLPWNATLLDCDAQLCLGSINLGPVKVIKP